MQSHHSAEGLAGHWRLEGDCLDHSGRGNHGVNHGVDLDTGAFDGRGAYIEVPDSGSLRLGTGDFTLAAWIWTHKNPDGVVGDVAEKYDPDRRRGMTLAIGSSAGGYQGPGSDRHVHFGIDNAQVGQWQDCGRPNPASNYVGNSLTVFDGKLYAATSDARDEADWCKVYRYEGGQTWSDCGRVGSGKTTGVVPLVVHDGRLYAVTTTYDWTRVLTGDYEPGRLYRYVGGTRWEDCGEPGGNRTNNCAISFRGRIYVGGGPLAPGVYVRDDDGRWQPSIRFDTQGPQRCFPHAMMRFHGRLYVGYPGIHAFDGQEWAFVGLPAGGPHELLQTHSLHVHQGRLCAGTWPHGKVAVHLGGQEWVEIGRVGADGTEVNALVVYNGKLYGGSIPRAEVCRYDGGTTWTSLKRFYSPDGWTPAPPPMELTDQGPTREELNEWSRVTSLTVHDGKLFASTASCTSSILDAPCDVRGKVFCLEAGRCASYGSDAGPGWKHLVAIRRGRRLELYIDSKPVAMSSEFDPAAFDLTNNRPLRIGFGQTDYFHGKMRDVRLYSRAMAADAIAGLASMKPR
ncbi:MAG: LamG domain-containing protein [Planctomycetes bacterium]|nr:LamG domain-containing protein [Planctomycetota bacterium]